MRTNERHYQRLEQAGHTIKVIDVEVHTLDYLLRSINPSKVNFITLDVEGAELLALKGCKLDRWRPEVLMIEDNSGGTDQRVCEFMLSMGYRKLIRLGCNDVYVPFEGDLE